MNFQVTRIKCCITFETLSHLLFSCFLNFIFHLKGRVTETDLSSASALCKHPEQLELGKANVQKPATQFSSPTQRAGTQQLLLPRVCIIKKLDYGKVLKWDMDFPLSS